MLNSPSLRGRVQEVVKRTVYVDFVFYTRKVMITDAFIIRQIKPDLLNDSSLHNPSSVDVEFRCERSEHVVSPSCSERFLYL